MKKIFALSALLAAAGVANAQIFNEIGDASQLLPGQDTGIGALSFITGSLSGNADVDLYAITITDFANFSATVGVTAGFDSQLFLFNAAGFGIVSNDDVIGGGTSAITAGTVTSNGLYYIAISSYNLDPTSSGGNIFPNSPFTAQLLPTGAGGAFALSGWTGFGSSLTNAYEIRFTGAERAIVPTPAAAALLGLGGLAAFRRRR